MENGWIKLYRKSKKSRVFKNADLWKLWSWCLMKAGHEERWVSVSTGKGETEVHLMPGQFIFGRHTAAQELKQKPSSTYKRMMKLKNMQNLDIQSNTHYSIVTILNWDKYQLMETEKEQPKEQPSSNQVAAKEQPSSTNKNDKNDKNDKNINIYTQRFNIFWSKYPKKKSKGNAEKVWFRIKPTKELFENILLKLEKAKSSLDWKKKNGQFIPYPASWLNAKGWEDDYGNQKDDREDVNIFLAGYADEGDNERPD